ncbi:capsule biosynthesis protein [Planktotalea arctica]|uniref:capsule biosynthesis protein n=1 Tax=Planktotalea arctica TaxID=1481893 RepID=UPI000A17658A|nr:capsule biosynthesis protein [Planktotalea arctica]
MTTKPKAKKFRIKRTGSLADEQSASQAAAPAAPSPVRPSPSAAAAPVRPQHAPPRQNAAPPTAQSQAQPAGQAMGRIQPVKQAMPSAAPQAQARAGLVSSAAEVSAEQDIDEIKREGLTGRQLRMARRAAQKYGLAPTSDYDAVRQLRTRGIDPFQRTNMLELVVPGEGKSNGGSSATQPLMPQDPTLEPINLPQTMSASANMPTHPEGPSPAERRAEEISQIQRDIAKRRRRKLALLFTRLGFFVFLPTLIVAYYYYAIATPMYATKSEFLILKAETSGGAMGGLLSGTQFATNQDAIAVQSYLTSKDAMLRLDADVGFNAHFMNPEIDAIQRLEADPSTEDAYKIYKKAIEIGYDPTEGVIKMEVIAADPVLSAEFSKALISYAEERVDNLSLRKRENQVADAEMSFRNADKERREAQERMVRLQQEGNILDPEGKIASLRSQINNIEVQVQEKELQLAALLDNNRPNRAKVEGAQGDVRRFRALLDRLNDQMTNASQGENSLAELASQIQLAQADVATRDLMLASALEQLEQTRREAASQARYLTTSVEPVPSEDPTYPRKFENSILAFLVFAGIYLMISLTASILREQVSS